MGDEKVLGGLQATPRDPLPDTAFYVSIKLPTAYEEFPSDPWRIERRVCVMDLYELEHLRQKAR
jgi:hypothetical protein